MPAVSQGKEGRMDGERCDENTDLSLWDGRRFASRGFLFFIQLPSENVAPESLHSEASCFCFHVLQMEISSHVADCKIN